MAKRPQGRRPPSGGVAAGGDSRRGRSQGVGASAHGFLFCALPSASAAGIFIMSAMASTVTGFVSGGRAFGAGVSVRFSQHGVAWVRRATAAVGGHPPSRAPAALFFPFKTQQAAAQWARAAAVLLGHGFRVSVKSGRECSAWSGQASPPPPAFAVKIILPVGQSLHGLARAHPAVFSQWAAR